MSKLGAAFLTVLALVGTQPAATPPAAAAVPHRIARDAAWGCRDRSDLINLLFLGLSASFQSALANAVADGRCIYFKPGENVVIVAPDEHGIVRVQRGGTAPAVYWTPLRNVD